MGNIQNLEEINIIKRNKIEQGMKFVNEMDVGQPVIEKIIVFGSAIRGDCTEDSDIDLCIVSQYDDKNENYRNIRCRLMDEIDDVCDILTYKRLNNEFKSIVDDGVVVYER